MGSCLWGKFRGSDATILSCGPVIRWSGGARGYLHNDGVPSGEWTDGAFPVLDPRGFIAQPGLRVDGRRFSHHRPQGLYSTSGAGWVLEADLKNFFGSWA